MNYYVGLKTIIFIRFSLLCHTVRNIKITYNYTEMINKKKWNKYVQIIKSIKQYHNFKFKIIHNLNIFKNKYVRVYFAQYYKTFAFQLFGPYFTFNKKKILLFFFFFFIERKREENMQINKTKLKYIYFWNILFS